MRVIQISDEQAAAQGLTLEAWLLQLARVEERRPNRRNYTLAELIAQCDSTAPLSDEDTIWLDAPSAGREAP